MPDKSLINASHIQQIKQQYEEYKQSNAYQARAAQFAVTELNRRIIVDTLSQGVLKNISLTGFIQMFKHGCANDIFDKYLLSTIDNKDKRKELNDYANEVDQWGYTGSGLNSVTGLTESQLNIIYQFLTDAFKINSTEDAIKLCEEFEANQIPQIKSGIYSPWLYYINPNMFPIINNSYNNFLKWLGLPKDYPKVLASFSELNNALGEKEFGQLDMFVKLNENKFNMDQNVNYKAQFKAWLKANSTEKSNKTNSYIKALEILSEIIGQDIFESTDVRYLDSLYKDLIDEQGKPDGKYAYAAAPSYGKNGFYSSATKQYILFIGTLGKVDNRSFYKYSPGKQANRWAIDLAQGEMSVSYKEYNIDLSEINSLEELNVQVGLAPKAQANTTWNMFLFKSARIGDVIFANKGKNVLVGIGIITGEYRFDNSRNEFKHVRSVNWIIDREWNYLADRITNYQTLFRPDTFSPTLPYKEILSLIALDNPDLIPTLKLHKLYYQEKGQIVKIVKENQMQHSLNQILYGPPGTGKTYHTINKALAIVENKADGDLALESRESLKERYQAYAANGQIVFTTFHQSMSYEDFVEGIKPEIEEDEEGSRTVVYEVKDGVFKSLCRQAVKPYYDENTSNEFYGFEDAWNELVAEANRHLENGEKLVLKIQTPNLGLKINAITEKGNLLLKPIYSEDAKEYTVSHSRAEKLQFAFPNLSSVKNIDKEFRAVIGGSNSTAYWAVINYVNQKINDHKVSKSMKQETTRPHVLIIDEINRGNVSAIFGELITLIEESKRAGASEALELTLPYSKEKFSVPTNLYIIGTMNTADRSVEALDTALRRRFAFKEMMPQPFKITVDGALAANAGILDGIDLAAVLTKINDRIAILLDVDHQIGHSYLINVVDRLGLANAFNNCIMPLLKEYFYHDDEKIAWVLGSGFVSIKQQSDNVQSLFPVMMGLEVHSISSKNRFELNVIDENNIITALETFLNGG